MSDLVRRVLTALVLIPLAIGAVVLGGWWFGGLILLVACRAQWELYGLGERAGLHVQKELAVLTGAIVVLIPLWAGALPLAFVSGLTLVAFELYRRNDRPLAVASLAVFGVFYPVALAAWVLHLRVAPVETVGEEWTVWLVVGALATVWVADTMAYFVGRSIGRRPLFKRVSPKKTIEGMVAGLIGAVGAALLLWVVVPPFTGILLDGVVHWYHAVVIGLIAGAVGTYGDLIESLFKRSVDVKDTSDLLPGHGGMLDRIDALVVAVPVMALYLEYVAGIF